MSGKEQNKVYKVSVKESGCRLDKAALQLLIDKLSLRIPRSFVQAGITEALILLQGRPAKPESRVTVGELISCTPGFFQKWEAHKENKSQNSPTVFPEVIAETSDFVVVAKPAGLLVHTFPGSQDAETLETWLMKNIPETQALERSGIVHRLDRNTSGLLLVAKNQEAQTFFKRLFQQRRVKKTYIALCEGHFKELSGAIDNPLVRKKGSFKRLAARSPEEAGSRTALTEYKVIARFKNHDLALVYPKTGRTHQIRAHMKALGHPIAGDVLYGSKQPSPLKRQFLHAWALQFAFGGQEWDFSCSLPKDLESILKTLDGGPILRYDDEAFEGLFVN